MPKDNLVVTRQVEALLAELPEVDQLKRLLVLVAGSVKAWADRHGVLEQQVGQTLRGERAGATYLALRDRMAEDTGWSRERVDQAIEAGRAVRAQERVAVPA